MRVDVDHQTGLRLHLPFEMLALARPAQHQHGFLQGVIERGIEHLAALPLMQPRQPQLVVDAVGHVGAEFLEQISRCDIAACAQIRRSRR